MEFILLTLNLNKSVGMKQMEVFHFVLHKLSCYAKSNF